MEPILMSCAGMDVHEKKIDVCIAHGSFDKPPIYELSRWRKIKCSVFSMAYLGMVIIKRFDFPYHL